MLILRAEMHVHTVLSPCAEVEMIPPLIIQEALARNINLLAITDHNSTHNVQSVMKAAEGSDIKVLPGMELQTREEVHLLCIFADMETANTWQTMVDAWLPATRNSIEYFGEQFLVDETGDFLGREDRLLITSANVSFDTAIQEIHRLGGLAIPAHVDRPAFGLVVNLGFIPQGVEVDAVEFSRNIELQVAKEKYPQLLGLPWLRGGDAHRLDEITGANILFAAQPSFDELKLALGGKDGRSVKILL